MIKIENTEVYGWEAAIRGMRNPKNSWDKSDSYVRSSVETDSGFEWVIGENDLKLMRSLAQAGSDHGKFLRMITVTADITAPTFWWAEFDTYKVGTVRNSCSKMHKIHAKAFESGDFAHEGCREIDYACGSFLSVIETCERLRQDFNNTHDKKYWRALIELLPEGYNLRATVQLNYEVLRAIDRPGRRRDHKLDEWRRFCSWAETLPYFKEICLEN